MKQSVKSSQTPNYALYGDSQSDAQAGFLHIETVQESSRPYRGVIKPHKHSDLFQVLIIEKGEAEIQLEESKVSINEPVVCDASSREQTRISLSHGYKRRHS